MPRSYKMKTDRGTVPRASYEAAARDVLSEPGQSLRDAAGNYGLCHVSLMRFIRKWRTTGLDNPPPQVGYQSPNVVHVFTHDQERILSDYFVQSANINYGLSAKDGRKLAFQCGVKFGISMPPTWAEKEEASQDWMRNFMKRTGNLSLRRPEATSLARGMGFNRANVGRFFDNLAKLMDKHKFGAENIYNMDETGVTTVQKPTRVIAPKGAKNVSSVVSAERGTLITLACAVNAIGNYVPPMLIFPRKNFRDHFITNGYWLHRCGKWLRVDERA
ncbi:tigger transposable element-derived protein 6-like protein [Elysia marginata]|uniref:Tigger transposable element-derived protein 6-like protein n=1 Tax=Elysia marginata TaxID=1093978 RepID=A0AAV4FYG6_9GAST|nr:tigger transposable element-derived protein 6-like protein [Elysia marginata]